MVAGKMSKVVAGGAVGLITSSRHWGVREVDVDGGWGMVMGPVGVAIVGGGWSLGDGATD